MPLGKSASSRGGGRGRGGGAERVEQSGAAPTMDGVVRLSTAATQTELSMDALARLEENQAELKVDNRRLRQRGYQRKYNRKLKRKAFERKRNKEMMRLQRFCLSTRVNKETRKQKLLERKRKLKLAAPKLPGLAEAAPEAYRDRVERVVRMGYVFTDKGGRQIKEYLTHEDRVELEKYAHTSTPRRRRRPSADVAE